MDDFLFVIDSTFDVMAQPLLLILRDYQKLLKNPPVEDDDDDEDFMDDPIVKFESKRMKDMEFIDPIPPMYEIDHDSDKSIEE